MLRLLPIILGLVFGTAMGSAQSPDKELRGQILNAAGEPVENATVTVRAVTRATGTRYGNNEDVDASTKTDAKGEFVVRGQNPFLAATITAEALGLAKGVFTELSTGGLVHALTLLEGVSIIGALTKNGQPLPGVKIGVSDTDRGSRIFTIDATAATDAKGRFRIPNLPPKRDYFLFGMMESFADKSALPTRRITAGADGSVLDVGEIGVRPGYIIEGRLSIQLPHIPIVVSRYWGRGDAQRVETDTQGGFHFDAVPADIVTLSLEVPGYRLSLQNGSLNPSDPAQLLGRVVTNKTDLQIDLEQGAALDPLNISTAALAEEPLRGAEPPSAGTNTLEVTGVVTDAETGERISELVTTEGRINRARGYDWFFTRKHRHKNGAFKTYATVGEYPPIVVVQSDNHIPWVSGAITTPTNFNIKLEKGVHPRGVVLKPDGQPATNVAVYLASGFGHTRIENFGVDNTAQRAFTDARGRFYFSPQKGAFSALVFDPAGFAETPIDELLKTGEVRLKALAKLEGKLLLGGAPASNEVIHVTTTPVPYHWHPLELPAYSITFTTRTDANGDFAFDRLPPTLMEIAHSPILSRLTPGGAAIPLAAPAGAMQMNQTQRVLPVSGETTRVTLGGQGRLVTGRVELAGHDGEIDWRGSPQSMENVVAHEGPSDAAMKSLLEKLVETRRPGATDVQRKAAEEAYQAERHSFALAAKKFFATEKGMQALLASHRYFLQFQSDGSFRVQDVPPGKYRITMMLSNPDPSAAVFSRRFLGEVHTEVAVPEGPGPFDVGVIQAKPPGKLK